MGLIEAAEKLKNDAQNMIMTKKNIAAALRSKAWSKYQPYIYWELQTIMLMDFEGYIGKITINGIAVYYDESGPVAGRTEAFDQDVRDLCESKLRVFFAAKTL